MCVLNFFTKGAPVVRIKILSSPQHEMPIVVVVAAVLVKLTACDDPSQPSVLRISNGNDADIAKLAAAGIVVERVSR